MEHVHRGGCHCGAITLELRSARAPKNQVIGACQCSFCRKHNARTFSDPKAIATITVNEPEQLQRYGFGLRTSEVVLCRRCGVYVAMAMTEGAAAWTTISIDALDDRTEFTSSVEPRDFSSEQREGRIERRKSRWTPTNLVGWPSEI